MRVVHRVWIAALNALIAMSAVAQSASQITTAAAPQGSSMTVPDTAAATRSHDAIAPAPGAASSQATVVPPTDPLFTALGGRAGIVAITADLVTRAASDPKIGSFFVHTDLPELKQQLADQICAVSGGGCVYGGANMKKAHADMHIQRADFNRLVELLQLAMDAHGVPFADQNRLLARLAPMHREVIERDAVR